MRMALALVSSGKRSSKTSQGFRVRARKSQQNLADNLEEDRTGHGENMELVEPVARVAIAGTRLR